MKKLLLIILSCNLYIYPADTSWPNLTAWKDFQPLIAEFFTQEITDFSKLTVLSIDQHSLDIKVNYKVEGIHKRFITRKEGLNAAIEHFPEAFRIQLQETLEKCNILYIIRQRSIHDLNRSHTFILHSFYVDTQESFKDRWVLSAILNKKKDGTICFNSTDHTNEKEIEITTQNNKSYILIKIDPETKNVSFFGKETRTFINIYQAPQKVADFLMTEEPLFKILICAKSLNNNQRHLFPFK